MTGTFIGITGPAGAGKDTAAQDLTSLLSLSYNVRLLAGSPLYRSAALFLLEQDFDPTQPLPADAFAETSLSINGGKVCIHHGSNTYSWTSKEYGSSEAGQAGSFFAKNSPDVYKGFVSRAVVQNIQDNSKQGHHTIMGARDSHTIAQSLDIPSLLCYLTASVEERWQRLGQRFQGTDDIEARIAAEFDRDRQDEEHGTLPAIPRKYISLNDLPPGTETYSDIRTVVLDNTNLNRTMTTARLAYAATAFFEELRFFHVS